MQMAFLVRRYWKESLLVVLLWSMAAVLFAGQTYLHHQTAGRPVTFYAAYRYQWVFCFLWAILTPVILFLAERYRIVPGIWRRRVLLHAGVSIVLAVVQRGTFALVDTYRPLLWMKAGDGFQAAHYFKSVFFLFDYGIPIYWVILAVHHSLTYYKRSREENLRVSELEKRLVYSELEALKMQLHPRFVFTTLNSISGLMKSDMKAADRMIARLGDFLRTTLENAGAREVSLQRELEFLRCYLEIEEIRLEGRLKVDMEIDPLMIDVQVPNLILQPIVENAIMRWIPSGSVAWRIRIRADRTGGMLRIQVADNGPAFISGFYSEGFGIVNTRARLRQMYGDTHRFRLGTGPGEGMIVILEIPMKFPEVGDPAA